MVAEQKSEKVIGAVFPAPIYACSEPFIRDNDGMEDTLPGPDAPTQPRASQRQIQRQEKSRQAAEKMIPRPCRLPSCGQQFTPKRVQDWKSEFCCKEHQKEFWISANRISATALKTGAVVTALVAPQSEYRPGVSQKEQVLAILMRTPNQWVTNLRHLLPGVNLNVISKLRQDGYEIEMREVGERPFTVSNEYRPNWRRYQPGGQVEYQYRLVTVGARRLAAVPTTQLCVGCKTLHDEPPLKSHARVLAGSMVKTSLGDDEEKWMDAREVSGGLSK